MPRYFRPCRRLRSLVAMALAPLSLMLAAPFASAQDAWPSRAVRWVVGFPPGGGIDLGARVFAARLQEALGVPMVVENRPGVTGQIASEAVKQAAPDGYTLLVAAAGQMTMNPVLFPKLPYDPINDFAPITTLAQFAVLVAVNPSLPVNTLQELVATAKARPGQLAYSHGGAAHQIAGEMLNQLAGIDLRAVPYKGGAPAVNAAIAGDVPVTVVDIAAAVGQLRAGKLRALVVASPQRSSLLPEVRTAAESGMPGLEMSIWSALVAPAGTPVAITKRLRDEVVRASGSAEVRERLRNIGMEPGGIAPEALTAMMKAEIARYGAVVKAAGIKPE